MSNVSEQRDYLQEAKRILLLDSRLLTEKAHLIALDEHYQVMLIKIANQLEHVKREVLNG